MEVSGQLHNTGHIIPRTVSLYLTELETGWAPELPCTVRRKSACFSQESNDKSLVLDFKLSPHFECHVLSSGLFSGVCSLNANV
jgi:hypothetical protein